MRGTQHIVAEPLFGITPERARAARVRALRFVLDCYDQKKGTRPGAPDDAKGLENDRAKTSIHE